MSIALWTSNTSCVQSSISLSSIIPSSLMSQSRLAVVSSVSSGVGSGVEGIK